MRTPGRDATLGSDAPQSPSPPTLPGGAVALKYQDLASACLFILMLGRRIPIQPPVYVGCGFDDFPNYVGHTGIDFYKTTGDVYVARSCGFSASGVPGANVYPAFPGCPHQGTTGKAKVIYAADTGDAEIGKCVILEHTDNTHLIWTRTVYMHLDTVAVAAGAFVATTDVIGTVGHAPSAPVTNSHLHFEVWEQRAANPGWRTAAEIARMPDVIQLGRAAINPEKYLPPLAGSELLHIASPPPPAGKPNWSPLDLPSWCPQARLPMQNYASANFEVQGGMGFWPPYEASIISLAAGGPAVVWLPFLDAPDGRIYVVGSGGPGRYGLIWALWIALQHSGIEYREQILTYYTLWWAASTTLLVAAGDWISPTTPIATSPRQAGTTMEWGVFRRRAASSQYWLPGEPIDLNTFDPWGVDAVYGDRAPSCYLSAEPSFFDWPPVGYPGCP